jgi:Domain of unknown function (DUF222)
VFYFAVGFHRVADMSAAHAEPPSADGMVARLDEMLAELADALIDKRPGCDAARIDRIARLEKLRAVTAALQGAESVRFAQSQLAEQLTADAHPSKIGRGIAEQIGLARRISPVTAAARRLNTARALWSELPDTYSQLAAGELSERVAETVVAETRHSTRRTAAGSMSNSWPPALARWGLRRPHPLSGRRHMRQIGVPMWSGVVPSANIGASVSGRHQTPWLC